MSLRFTILFETYFDIVDIKQHTRKNNLLFHAV